MSKVSEVLLVECMYCVMVLTFIVLFYQLDHSGQRNKYSMIQYWYRLKSNQSHMAIHIQALHFSVQRILRNRNTKKLLPLASQQRPCSKLLRNVEGNQKL